jgi:hypothetical protein
MGKSVAQPDESKKSLQFNTAVRTTQVEKVEIKNYGTEDWVLKPQVYTEYSQYEGFWKLKVDSIEIPVGQTTSLEVY